MHCRLPAGSWRICCGYHHCPSPHFTAVACNWKSILSLFPVHLGCCIFSHLRPSLSPGDAHTGLLNLQNGTLFSLYMSWPHLFLPLITPCCCWCPASWSTGSLGFSGLHLSFPYSNIVITDVYATASSFMWVLGIRTEVFMLAICPAQAFLNNNRKRPGEDLTGFWWCCGWVGRFFSVWILFFFVWRPPGQECWLWNQRQWGMNLGLAKPFGSA